jgi:Predicted integral membrane protein (DUF2269)
MTWYELLLFIHIAATVVWVGAGFAQLLIGQRYNSDGDSAAIQRFLGDQEWLAQRVFIPGSLTVVVFGIAIVIQSDAWTFGYLWIVIGLVGFAATFVTGLFMIKPTSERIAAQMERDGGLSAGTLLEIEKLIVKARVDYVVLFLVIADMVIKPTGDDTAVLIVMALILLGGVGYIAMRLRALDTRTVPASA